MFDERGLVAKVLWLSHGDGVFMRCGAVVMVMEWSIEELGNSESLKIERHGVVKVFGWQVDVWECWRGGRG